MPRVVPKSMGVLQLQKPARNSLCAYAKFSLANDFILLMIKSIKAWIHLATFHLAFLGETWVNGLLLQLETELILQIPSRCDSMQIVISHKMHF